MHQILLLGAGQSSAYLIKYLLNYAEDKNLFLTIAGICLEEILEKTKNHPKSKAIIIDATNDKQLDQLIQKNDLVISLLPPNMHFKIAQKCVLFSKNMLTASYVSDEMKTLDNQAKINNIILLNETGLDPGIDHMSAMQLFDKIKSKGGEIFSFESYCGGLIAPESDNNPWNYKFTWNPKNVVLAGQGGDAQFLENNQIKNIPYQSLFKKIRNISIDNIGDLEGYANRDSLKYQNTYGLQNVETLIRGTLRKKGFCKTWDILIQLGLTNNEKIIHNSENLTPYQFINIFLKESKNGSLISKIEKTIRQTLSENEIIKITYLNFEDDDNPIGLKNATAAQLLEVILKEKWNLSDNDKDLVLMIHQIGYILNGKKHFLQSSLTVTGNLKPYTAMSKTVGLPLGIASLLILENKINLKGVILPIYKEIYEPILFELEQNDIKFHEKLIS